MKALRWMGDRLAKLFSKVVSAEGTTSQQTTQNNVPQMMEDGSTMRGLPAVLETIMLYIGAVIAIAFFGWILFRLGKKILQLARESWDLLGKYLSASSEDYVDEVSDTRDMSDAERIRGRRRRHIRYKDDPTLPPSDQVRRRYQYLKHDHKEWTPGSTARENLPRLAAVIYEHARYSERSVSSEESRAFIDMVKDL